VDADVWFSKGVKSMMTNQKVWTSLDYFKQCYTIEQAHVASIFNIAVCYDLMGKFQCAKYYFELCIKMKPYMTEAYFGIILCNIKIGQYD